MKAILAAVFMTLMLSGCAKQTFSVKDGFVNSTPSKTVIHHFFIGGIGQSETVDAASVCGGQEKVVRTEVQQTFINGLLATVTFGIYTPREARVYCSA